MAYNKNSWEDGDIISSEKMNNIENGIYTNSVAVEHFLDLIYPVGAVYISVNDVYPGIVFGGTWQQIQGKFLLGASEDYELGSTGGSANATIVQHSHTINSVAISSSGGHDHDVIIDLSTSTGTASNAVPKGGSQTTTSVTIGHIEGNSGKHTHVVPQHGTRTIGESGTGKNMPPYLVVYMWKRTA